MKKLLSFGLLLVFVIAACEDTQVMSVTSSPSVTIATLPTRVPTSNPMPTRTPTVQPTATITPTTASPTPTLILSDTPEPAVFAQVTSMANLGIPLPQAAYALRSGGLGLSYDIDIFGLAEVKEITTNLRSPMVEFWEFYSQSLGTEWTFWNLEEYTIRSSAGPALGISSAYCWRKDDMFLNVYVDRLNQANYFTVTISLLSAESIDRLRALNGTYRECWKPIFLTATPTFTPTPTATNTPTVTPTPTQ